MTNFFLVLFLVVTSQAVKAQSPSKKVTEDKVEMYKSSEVKTKVFEELVKYKKGNVEFEGFLVNAYPMKSSLQPAVLVVHDWMGLTEKAKEKARLIAQLGYVVFAADIYGKGIRPKDQKEAGNFAGTYKKDRAKFRQHLIAAYDALKAQAIIDKNKISAAGYCFGGTGVIELARAGADVKGIISFHGGLDSPVPADGKNIKAKVLALHGADDPFVSEADLSAFEKEMKDSKVDWQLIKYGGAVHSFTDKSAGTDNSKGAAYNKSADDRSWIAMEKFLTEVNK
jgi:dienelactone hydrolase